MADPKRKPEPEPFDWRNPDYEPIFKERAERLGWLTEHPEELESLKADYKENLVAFVDDWGMTFDPRNAEVGLPTTIPFVLFQRQREFLEWLLARWKGREDGLVEKSRDMGVTWLCVAFSVWLWIFWDGTVTGFGSRKEEYVDKIGDPKSIFEKIRKYIDLLPEEFQPIGWNNGKHAPFMRIINPVNDAVIVGEAGDNIGRGNRTSIYFKDESAFYEHPDAIDAALSQTSNVKIDVSTPSGAGNPFYRKRHGGRIPVFVFDWHDDPRKDQRWYQKQKDTQDATIVAQEIDRDYEASISNAYISGELVRAAMARGPTEVQPMGNLRVSVDVARYGNCKTVITFRQGRVVLTQLPLAKLNTVAVAARVKDETEAYTRIGVPLEQIAVDVIGVGAGVADILRGWFPDKLLPDGSTEQVVVDVNVSERMNNGKDYNLRAFCYRQAVEWLKTGSLPNNENLKTDLTALQYGYRGGELLIESKEDAIARGIKSPDYGDSFIISFAKPAKYRKPRPKSKPWRARDRAMGS
jgi:hypothetical protein